MDMGQFNVTVIDGVETISARDIWKRVGSKRQFTNWIKQRVDKYGFIENEDYVTLARKVDQVSGAKHLKEYYLNIDSANKILNYEKFATKKQNKKSKTYIIRGSANKLIKIGMSIDVDKRMRILEMQGGQTVKIQLVIDGNIEGALHRKFAKHRKIGEWFKLSVEYLNEIIALCDERGIEYVKYN